MVGVVVDGHDIALYRVGGQVYATSNVCTHQHALLTDGYLDGDCVECPLHQGRFSIVTGEARDGPVNEDLRTYAVAEADGFISVVLD
jgi:nitrite reductase/ring-hydroxylating ferredoxin subunit